MNISNKQDNLLIVITFTLLLESINLSATRDSNFSCETSALSELKFRSFFNRRTLPIASPHVHNQTTILVVFPPKKLTRMILYRYFIK
jgi:hypothetical protein